jgi:Na+-driven multidrug efflux pump
MGVVWDCCLASTEGLGEAASVRVSFHLAEGFPAEAKLLASKVAFLALVEALALTSIFLITGPIFSESLTTDTVLQDMLNGLMGLTALANIPMAMAQIYWSLVGAQGKYAVASASILLSRWLVMIPIGAVFVYGFEYDVDALAGGVAVGYATAAFILSLHVFSSDWTSLSLSMQQSLLPHDDDDEDDDDSFSSDDASSTGF